MMVSFPIIPLAMTVHRSKNFREETFSWRKIDAFYVKWTIMGLLCRFSCNSQEWIFLVEVVLGLRQNLFSTFSKCLLWHTQKMATFIFANFHLGIFHICSGKGIQTFICNDWESTKNMGKVVKYVSTILQMSVWRPNLLFTFLLL